MSLKIKKHALVTKKNVKKHIFSEKIGSLKSDCDPKYLYFDTVVEKNIHPLGFLDLRFALYSPKYLS